MAYLSTKTYGHEVGLSATFRQWRAKSHCRLLHGYSLSFRFEFEANTLDDKKLGRRFWQLQGAEGDPRRHV